MKRLYSLVCSNPVWVKVFLFALTLTAIRVGDAIISYWAPVAIQNSLANPVTMGLVISFQSVIGFVCDLIFPHVLRSARVRRLIFGAIIMSAATSLLLFGSTLKPYVEIFIMTMTLWGIYYELVAFAQYQFVGSTVPREMRAGAWGVLGIFSNLAYFVGPLAATFLLIKGTVLTEGTIIVFLIIAFLCLTFFGELKDGELAMDLHQLNPWQELKHWLTLSEYVWPAIIMSLLLGFIDATFWTTGAVWTQKLAAINGWGSLFLPLYQLPPLFMGLIVARWGIYQGKKILTEKFLVIAGLVLASILVFHSLAMQLAIVFVTATALAICYPLLEGVYTDINVRLGKEQKHMIGLTSSVTNLAYIVWPPIGGWIALKLGELGVFGAVGIVTTIVAFVLLLITPKKLRLPETEIQSWQD